MAIPQRSHFKVYELGYIHIDLKYLPKMEDDSSRRYLAVGIDRATGWVHLEIIRNKTATQTRAFLKRLIAKAPFRNRKFLTDNGKEFTDRFCSTGERQPTGSHPFDRACAEQGLQHHLIKPRKPQTNGMGECFNGRISEVLKTPLFDSSQDLKALLERYLHIYNHQIPQKSLGYRFPAQALQQWQQKKPNLFYKSDVNHPIPNNN